MKSVPLRDFKETLIEQLVDYVIMLTPDNKEKRKVQRVDGALEQYKCKPHLVVYVNADRNCIVCSMPQKRQRRQ